MKCLVIGNGGREHALAAALDRAASVTQVYGTSPNAGMATVCEALLLSPTDIEGITAAVERLDIDLTVVGPEAPLVAGLADRLRAAGRAVLGPSAAAAQIEGSKTFAKALMDEAGIPTAAWARFTDSEAAIAWQRAQGTPFVVKADGLAAGKGVIVPETMAEAEAAIREILDDERFGEAGAELLLEERLIGPEISVIGLVDGTTVRAFPAARDHKRALDGDRGPNTGGMGAFSPVPGLSAALIESVTTDVLERTAAAMAARGTPFNGFLYAGLMLTPDGPRVLEFNARMGDPECQPLLARLISDAGEVFLAAATGGLEAMTLEFDPRPAVCVVVASGGYPGSYAKGRVISGLDAANALPGVTVYQAGTAQSDQGVVTAGGRVLGVTALGHDHRQAIARAYEAVGAIHFDGMQFRTDIAASALTTQCP